jgi:hypothetical protein
VLFDHVDRHKGEPPKDPACFQGQVKIQALRSPTEVGERGPLFSASADQRSGWPPVQYERRVFCNPALRH